MKNVVERNGIKIRQIRLFSRFLRFLCIFGIVFAPLLTLLYWVYGDFRIKYFKEIILYFQLSIASYIPFGNLSSMTKFFGFLVDLIPCLFFLAILVILSKLFRLYEHLQFFSKIHARYIRQIGGILLISQLINPFYIALRSYVLSPSGQKLVITFSGPSEYKHLLVAFGIFLVAYITEIGLFFEEEYMSTI